MSATVPDVSRSKKGDKITTAGGELTITCVGQRYGFGSGDTFDPDIQSPKSAGFSPDGKKLYINSLEGGKTVVYDAKTQEKLKVISHKFNSGQGRLWLANSGFYPFTHYDNGAARAFMGKPVEQAFSSDGRYVFTPYYRRSFDINAQDPSAMAVIDSRTDSIVLMTETGPLPKMVSVSNHGKLLAITHWGDNTVGFIDISDENPRKWRHLPPIAIGRKLDLNYSLETPVNRDAGSGFLLRGTVFLPGDSLLLVSGMAGPLNVIDLKSMKWIGSVPALSNARHLAVNGNRLYLSRNSAGEILSVDLDELVGAIREQRSTGRSFKIEGIRKVKVGGGARTIKVSPSGKYLFAACNTESAIYVVSTADMKVIGSITADSYPVGLDLSPDGRLLVSTSQGRKDRGGGNAVTFYEIEYAEPETAGDNAVYSDIDSPSATEGQLQPGDETSQKKAPIGNILIWIGAAICIITAAIVIIIRGRKC